MNLGYTVTNKVYDKLVQKVMEVCKQLGWIELAFEQDDETLFIVIDHVRYLVGPDNGVHPKDRPVYYAGIMIQHLGNREEPPSEDETTISKVSTPVPEFLLGCIIMAHTHLRLNWILEEINQLDFESTIEEEVTAKIIKKSSFDDEDLLDRLDNP